MPNYSGKVFAIFSEDRHRILTDVAWCNLQLLEYEKTSALFSGIPLDPEPFMFERTSDSRNCIQYYETQERAMEIIEKIQSREREPILEPMLIVSFNINIVIEDVLLYDPKLVKKSRFLDSFEREAARVYDKPIEYIKSFRTSDLMGYTDPIYQKAFEGWIIRLKKELQ